MTWWQIVIAVVSIWLVVLLCEPPRAIEIAQAAGWVIRFVFWSAPAWVVGRCVRKPCRCGHMPPKGARWCPRCGLNVRAWREQPVTLRANPPLPDNAPRSSAPAPPPLKRSQPWDCDHANEMPAACPCPADCYCRTAGSCRRRHICGRDGDPGAVAPLDGRCGACEREAKRVRPTE